MVGEQVVDVVLGEVVDVVVDVGEVEVVVVGMVEVVGEVAEEEVVMKMLEGSKAVDRMVSSC